MSSFRIAGRLGALVFLFLAAAPLHIASKLLLRRSGWPRRFLAAAAWICGARISVRGGALKPHSLLVCNHVTWLDILVLGGATGCAFVSKDELGHGFIHWLADQNRTIYVRRSHRRGSKEQALAIAGALEGTRPVALFPEGTVGPGDELLEFRSALLEAADVARRDVEVRPVAVDYGPAATKISWHGRSGKEAVLDILGRRGTLDVTLHLLDPLDRAAGRKALAREARAAIGETLASTRAMPRLYPRSR